MKYVILLADGMADEPIQALGGKTPLEYANTPVMDALARGGSVGMVRTVPMGMKPGSDVANLSVMGYDPAIYYSGRSPLEALSVGVPMEEGDIAFRCNLVTLTQEEPYEEKTVLDHSSGEISTEDADVLMDTVRQQFSSETLQFYTGTSYRHIMIWKGGSVLELEAPHDHLGERIGDSLPREGWLRDMMQKSYGLLNEHPLNRSRQAQGRNKANSLWLWGAGTRPALKSFYEKTGLKGAMISAVDLLKGIAVGAGMDVCRVTGATGSLDTNYEGKAQAAIEALLGGGDFVYIHVEAPDEMGHQGNLEHKIRSIAYIDSRILGPVKEALDQAGEDYRILVLPDHPTPVRLRTHTPEPVPYLLYDSRAVRTGTAGYSERAAMAAGTFVPQGHKLLDMLLQKEA